MTSHKYSGFEIMATNDDRGIRNHFVIGRDIFGDIPLPPPPPPKHFVYGKIDRLDLCFYRLIIDQNDPPPPASLLCLSKMSIKKLRAIASKNDLRGWGGLSKTDLVRFWEKNRYIFPDDFYKQRSLPSQLKAWVGLFADGNFAEHCTEVMLNTLTKMGYYEPTNQIKYYCWWKGLPLTGNNEKRLFLSKPNLFAMFEREMDSRFSEVAGNVAEPIRERLVSGRQLWSKTYFSHS